MIRLDSDSLSVRVIGWDNLLAKMEEIAGGLLAQDERSVASGDRGSGRTSEQMLAAPPRAVFVWCNERLIYPNQLADRLKRKDLRVVGPSWLEEEGWRGGDFSAVVLDHALKMTDEQRKGLSGLLRMVRQRGDTVKISQTPERQKLTPGKALYEVIEKAAHVWDRAQAAVEHGQERSEQARAAAHRCAMQAKEYEQEIGATISEASEAMEECIDAGRTGEVRKWIDALDEMRRIFDAVGVGVRLADGISSDPYHPQRLDWMWQAGHDAK